MSNTGVYKYNPETKEVEKVSEDIPGVPTQVYFPKSGKYYSENLGKTFHSKQEKRTYMQKKGIAEAG